MEFARRHVPPAARAATPVRLMATAGLRLLRRGEADAVLSNCRDELAASGFLFRPEWAEIISGRSEGLFAWMAANYAAGALEEAALQAAVARKSPRDWGKFAGLLELGGASAQVTFLLVDREQQQGEQRRAADGEGELDQQQQEEERAGGGQAVGGRGDDGGERQRGGKELDEDWREEGRKAPPAQQQQQEQQQQQQQQQLGVKPKGWRKRHSHIKLQLPGVSKRLFTHSYLGYGFDVLEAKLAAIALLEEQGADPCLPRG
jgi:hypothetical protein